MPAMPVTDPMRREPTADGFAAGSRLALLASGALLASTFAASLWLLPRQLVLPTLCLAALIAACAVGFVAWRSRAPSAAHPTYWDVAGALTFIGMCAAMLCEPDQVLPLLEMASKEK
jgi:hypothetical protein